LNPSTFEESFQGDTRECNSCGWTWWTLQEPEESLLPELYKVVIPRWGDGKSKTIEIKKL